MKATFKHCINERLICSKCEAPVCKKDVCLYKTDDDLCIYREGGVNAHHVRRSVSRVPGFKR